MNDCIFCKIIKGDIPAAKVYEDDEFLAFLDIRPLNKGHTLVVPKKHVETVLDIKEEKLCKMIAISKKIMHAISQAIAPDGYNLFCNNKPAAGQEVPHLHIHVAPRFTNDGHTFNWTHGEYKQGEMDKVREKIVKFL